MKSAFCKLKIFMKEIAFLLGVLVVFNSIFPIEAAAETRARHTFSVTYEKVTNMPENFEGTYVIVNLASNGHYAAMSSTSKLNGFASVNVESELSEDQQTLTAPRLTEWTFEKIAGEENAYYVSTVVDGETKYLNIVNQEYNGDSLVNLSAEKNKVTVRVNDANQVSLENGNSRLDWYGGGTRNKDIYAGYTSENGGANNYHTLYSEVKTYEKVTDLSGDLSGTYVIANIESSNSNVDAAISARSNTTVVTRLDPDYIGPKLLENEQKLNAAGLTEWTFEKADVADNTYYISTRVNGIEKYLNVEYYNGPGEANVTVGERTAVQITVIQTQDGESKLCIHNQTSWVDWYGAGRVDQPYFGGYIQDAPNENNYMTLYQRPAILTFDVNLPTKSVMGEELDGSYGGKWEEDNQISALKLMQKIEETEYKINWLEPPEDGYFTYAKDSFAQSYETIDFLKDENISAGKDFEFEGWTVNIGGEEHLFGKNAMTSVSGNSISITEGEQTVLVPSDTMLKGKWTQISDVVAFYIQKDGTVMDTEGDVASRGTNKFTRDLAVGRIYFAKETVGKSDTYGVDANCKIESLFTEQVDTSVKNSQLVIQYVLDENEKLQKVSNYTPENLAEGILKYIKNRKIEIEVCSPFTKEAIEIDHENADKDHYGIRWYVLKEEETDFIHIDGVLEAYTTPLNVEKCFYGLEEALIAEKENEFKIDVELKNKRDHQYKDYLSLETSKEQGYYTYEKTGDTFAWVMNVIKNENYAFEELNYEADNFDCVTKVELIGQDDSVKTELLNEKNKIEDINAKEAKTVRFKNYYTEKGTGALLIVKTDYADSAKKLQGAEFTLTSSDDQISIVGISGADGRVYFNNIVPGKTYILKETKAPENYELVDKTWDVVVEKNIVASDDKELTDSVIVKILDSSNKEETPTVCYSEEGLIEYEIENVTKEPEKESENKPEKEPVERPKDDSDGAPELIEVSRPSKSETNSSEDARAAVPTGDSSNVILFGIVFGLSFVAICFGIYYIRKLKK